MNFLDEIIQGIAKEYEKEKNKDQNYYGDKLSSNITKIWSDVEDILEKNNNITIKENKKEELGNNKMDKDRVAIDSIVKDLNKVKIAIDNRKDLNQYDIVRIVDGKYKALSDKNCRFLDYCEGIDKVFLQLDNLNTLYVNPEDIELVKKAKKEYDITIFNKMEKRNEKIKIVEDNNWITVILPDGTKSKKELKGENKTRIIEIVYYKAKARQYTKLRKELINNLINIK
ncbi:hypothetical protein [Clostridium botulinum]|uniref:hypothetical protein n=1 Tax=Clostridium botulinum TaxID=1491 RepID=UPI00174862F2|nr:hypothetical protein [Clostridium botulinum]MBD5589323.1 hypothetical protein [Clostridium botulinum]